MLFPSRFPRAPAAAVAIAYAAGVLCDRYVTLDFVVWVGLSLICGLSWLFTLRSRYHKLAGCLLLMTCFSVGAARHHQIYSLRSMDEISLFVATEAKPVTVVGVLSEPPEIVSSDVDPALVAWRPFDKSRSRLECWWIETDRDTIPVSGAAQLQVVGHLVHANVGDVVQVRGWLTRPGPADNPGGFDYRKWLRNQGIGCVLFSDHPDAVRVMRPAQEFPIARAIDTVGQNAQMVLRRNLDHDLVPTASALMLGMRSNLTLEDRERFAQSGAMHLLAISGLHVGILAGLIWFLCRLANASAWSTTVTVIAVTIGFAMLTGARPSVIRATVFVCLFAITLPGFRTVSLTNMLALASLILLVARPADLFDVGAQLSFLAVMGIGVSLHAQQTFARWRTKRTSRRGNLLALREQSVLERFLRFLLAGALRLYVMTLFIWMFTAPLVAKHFHLVAPVGIVLNVVLIPGVFLLLTAGFIMILAGLLAPGLEATVGWAVNGGMRLFETIVSAGAKFQGGHFHVTNPPLWWLVGYYGLLLGGILLWRYTAGRQQTLQLAGDVSKVGDLSNTSNARPTPASDSAYRQWVGRVAIAGGLLWTACGLFIGLRPATDGHMKCTFLSVGHGLSVLMETPTGETLLYDAGSLHGPRRAQRAVLAGLWNSGHSGIDTLIVSHSDIDHFNAIPSLLETVPVGSIVTTSHFAESPQPGVQRIWETVRSIGIPVHFISESDRLTVSHDVHLEILHPTPDDALDDDNQTSLTLALSFGGRSILLAGDLEKEGLSRLLQRYPTCQFDVILSPHHGSLNANPQRLAEWASPEWVVVSGSSTKTMPQLRETYGGKTRVLTTAESGAITFSISPSGDLQVESVLEAE